MGTYFSHDVSSGGGGGGAVTIADGADVTEGAIADIAVTGDSAGTISGKLRGLVKILTDVWDSVNHVLGVSLPASQISTLTPLTSVTANQGSANATPWNDNISQVGGNAVAVNAGIASTGTQRVVQATANVVNITQVTVPATAGGISLIAGNANRIKVRVTNTGTTPVYIFNTSSPTTANGDYLAGIAGYPWISRYEGQLWAITGGGTQVVTVYEESSA